MVRLLLRYAKSRPNGKLIYNSIMNGPYVRRMIPEPGDADREVPVPETFHEQTDDELTEAEIKKMEADDQAIQTILLGLPEDIYAAVDSCETAQEIWLCVQQMMKGSDIGIQEKKAKLFNEWERYAGQKCWVSNGTMQYRTSESVVQDAVGVQNVGNQNGQIVVPGITNQNPNGNGNVVAARAEGNATGNNVTDCSKGRSRNHSKQRVRFECCCTELDEIEEVNASHIFMVNLQQASTSRTQIDNAPVYDSDGSVKNLKDSSDPITVMNNALALMAKAFKLNTIPTNNNQRSSLIPCNSQIGQPDMNTSQDIKMQMVDDNVGNQAKQNAVHNDRNEVGQNAVQNPGIQNVENMNGLSVVSEIANQYGNVNVVTAPAKGNGNGINGNPIRCYNCRGEGHYASNYTVKSRKHDAAYLQQQLQIAQEEEAGIQST
ncbi:hypothetical protein Tco_1041502 [Tanacetum coccineum]|uniref:CCHC-type domain-containing protein n=1 Tax=Tanacetum coccineum TaxID=301880 RepID=A0ABQ5GGB5_9ASTR